MVKCKFCAEDIKKDAIKCKHCGESLVVENIENIVITGLYSECLQKYNTLMPKLGFEIVSTNSDISGYGGSTSVNSHTSFTGKDSINVKSSGGSVSTTYTLSIRRDKNLVRKEILDITDEYLELLENNSDSFYQKPFGNHIAPIILSYLPMSFVIIFGIPAIVGYFSESLAESMDSDFVMIPLLIVIPTLYTMYRNKRYRDYNSKHNKKLNRFNELTEIINK